MRLLVTGGYFDESGECFIERVDLARGTRERLLTFVPPAAHRLAQKGFTGAAWQDDDTLLVCSFDAVWRIQPSTGRCTGRLHQPDFNDLHGVLVEPSKGLIHVCNTGLDAIETFDLDARFLGRMALSPAWFEARRLAGEAVERSELARVLKAGWNEVNAPSFASPSGDYYTKPSGEPFHRKKVRDYAHPNHLVRWNGRLIATLLSPRELRCVQGYKAVAKLASPPHDGVVVGDWLWVTTVDGRIWSVEPSGQTHLLTDVSATGHSGWCRGLFVCNEGIAVGLTAIQRRPQYAWRDFPYEQTETSVLWLERETGRLMGRVLFDGERFPKVFALLPCKGAWA